MADTNGNGIIENGDRKSLWLLDFETKEERLLVENLGHNAEGRSFSPDGKWLVFGAIFEDPVEPANSFLDILIADASNGSNLLRVIDDEYMNAAPRWLPILPK